MIFLQDNSIVFFTLKSKFLCNIIIDADNAIKLSITISFIYALSKIFICNSLYTLKSNGSLVICRPCLADTLTIRKLLALSQDNVDSSLTRISLEYFKMSSAISRGSLRSTLSNTPVSSVS